MTRIHRSVIDIVSMHWTHSCWYVFSCMSFTTLMQSIFMSSRYVHVHVHISVEHGTCMCSMHSIYYVNIDINIHIIFMSILCKLSSVSLFMTKCMF